MPDFMAVTFSYVSISSKPIPGWITRRTSFATANPARPSPLIFDPNQLVNEWGGPCPWGGGNGKDPVPDSYAKVEAIFVVSQKQTPPQPQRTVVYYSYQTFALSFVKTRAESPWVPSPIRTLARRPFAIPTA